MQALLDLSSRPLILIFRDTIKGMYTTSFGATPHKKFTLPNCYDVAKQPKTETTKFNKFLPAGSAVLAL